MAFSALTLTISTTLCVHTLFAQTTPGTPIAPAPGIPVITPAPTNPAPILCESSGMTGNFNNAPISFEIRIGYYGDMFFYINGFTVTNIRAYDKANPTAPLTQTTSTVTGHISISELQQNTDVIIEVDGTGAGIFDALWYCTALPPTFPPPSTSPTNQPSTTPTIRGITPAPTHPGEIQCNSPVSGDFNGLRMSFKVQIPYRGDIEFYIDGQFIVDNIWTTIRHDPATNANNPPVILPQSSSNSKIVSDVAAGEYVTFEVDGIGKSTFHALAKCYPNLMTPTFADMVTCGGPEVWGEFNNVPLFVWVYNMYEGRLVFEISGIFGFEITKISVYDENDLSNPIQQSYSHEPTKIIMSELLANTKLMFKIEGIGNGLFLLSTTCTPFGPTPPITPITNPQQPVINTLSPTKSPTMNPVVSNGRTTPPPTHPGLIQCGVPMFGDFIGDQMLFGVSLPYKADLRFVITGIIVTSIKAYNAINRNVILAASISKELIVSNVDANTYLMIVVDGQGNGIFSAMLFCTSLNQIIPTPLPSTPSPIPPPLSSNNVIPITSGGTCPGIQVRDPTHNICSCPQQTPTGYILPVCVEPFIQNPITCDCEVPTKQPTFPPTLRPTTNKPSINPTLSPTMRPSTNPTTPSPTHPGEILCGHPVFGHFNGDHLVFSATMIHNVDITFVITGIAVTSIKAYNANPTSLLTMSATQQLLIPNVVKNTDIIFVVEGVGKSMFNAAMFCETGEPTKTPSFNPTTTPTVITMNPTMTPSAFPTISPTVRPTNNPTKRPSMHPTNIPTKIPSKIPTANPTTVPPTKFPTKFPTNFPTKSPTKYPTRNPSLAPSISPTTPRPTTMTLNPTKTPSFSPTTAIPTATPTTAAPTHPGQSECGSTIFGDFNGDEMRFNVLIPYNGDISFYITGVDLTGIKAFHSQQPNTIITQTPAGMNVNSLTVFNILANTDIMFVVYGNGKSLFNAMINCVSHTHHAINGQQVFTTKHPTKNPTTLPPTLHPTSLAPSSHPTTPFPTHPILRQCGVPISGDFNGQQMVFNVDMPFSGDIIFFITGDMTITTISSYNFIYPTTVLSQTPMVGINALSIHNVAANAHIVIKVDGVGKGQFRALTHCISEAITINQGRPVSIQPVQLQCGVNDNSMIGGLDADIRQHEHEHNHNLHGILLNCCETSVSHLTDDVLASPELNKNKNELDQFGHAKVYEVVLAQSIIVVEDAECDILKISKDEIVEKSIVETKELMAMEKVSKSHDTEIVIKKEGHDNKDEAILSPFVIFTVILLLILFIAAILMAVWTWYKKKQNVVKRDETRTAETVLEFDSDEH